MTPPAPQILRSRVAAGGGLAVCLATFFVPLSTSLLGLFTGLAAIAWLLSGAAAHLAETLRRCPPAAIALTLFVYMAVASFYSPAPPLEAVDSLKKYRELLLFPVIVSLLAPPRWHDLTRRAFMAGCLVLMLVSYLMFFGLLAEDRYGHSVVYHITHSFFMALMSFWALHLAADPGRFRYLWGVLALAGVVNLFYVAPGRTGMFVFSCLAILFLYQRLKPLKFIVGMILFSSLLGVVYLSSDNFSGRLQEAVAEIVSYEPGQARTSIGQRFDWWVASLRLIAAKPVIGHGSGSFPLVHQQAIEGTDVTPTDNPHNEYLLIGVQFGLVGLLLFFALLASQLLYAKMLPDRQRWLLQGVVVAIATGSLMNSLLFDSQQGHSYLLLSGALMAARLGRGRSGVPPPGGSAG